MGDVLESGSTINSFLGFQRADVDKKKQWMHPNSEYLRVVWTWCL